MPLHVNVPLHLLEGRGAMIHNQRQDRLVGNLGQEEAKVGQAGQDVKRRGHLFLALPILHGSAELHRRHVLLVIPQLVERLAHHRDEHIQQQQHHQHRVREDEDKRRGGRACLRHAREVGPHVGGEGDLKEVLQRREKRRVLHRYDHTLGRLARVVGETIAGAAPPPLEHAALHAQHAPCDRSLRGSLVHRGVVEEEISKRVHHGILCVHVLEQNVQRRGESQQHNGQQQQVLRHVVHHIDHHENERRDAPRGKREQAQLPPPEQQGRDGKERLGVLAAEVLERSLIGFVEAPQAGVVEGKAPHEESTESADEGGEVKAVERVLPQVAVELVDQRLFGLVVGLTTNDLLQLEVERGKGPQQQQQWHAGAVERDEERKAEVADRKEPRLEEAGLQQVAVLWEELSPASIARGLLRRESDRDDGKNVEADDSAEG
mmetsp:Transcript_65013/g.145198  ORF Transcript_65013/g.145198 Transcript_65013/m.145198 type:complete len:433 (-) Transcript_65013:834-2132(-)